MKKLVLAKDSIILYFFILVVWGFYRLLFRLPENIEELLLKPLIWLLPTLYIVSKERAHLDSIGWSLKNIFKSLYLGIGIGVIFAIEALITHLIKYQGFSLVEFPYSSPNLFYFAFLVSIVTAIIEETVFRGFLFNRALQIIGNEFLANILTAAGWVLIHVPITFFILRYSISTSVLYLFLVFIFGVAANYVFARSKTITASVLLHVFWSWSVVLFR